MKKIFIVLSVLMTLTLGAGSALAVSGAVDNVPGSDFVVPFLVSLDRVDTTINAGPTTYLNVSEVRGFATDFHLHFCNTLSVRIATRELPITHWGSVMRDIAYYIRGFSPTELAGLTIIELDGVRYYAGYIYGENRIWTIQTPGLPAVRVRGTQDNVIASMYLLDLAAGQAASSRVPMKEFYNASAADLILQATGSGTAVDPTIYTSTAAQLARWAITGTSSSPSLTGALPVLYTTSVFPYLGLGSAISYERFSPAALAAASNLTWANAITTANWVRRNAANEIIARWSAPHVAWFRMLPEYYINSSTGDTRHILWQNGLPNGTDFHIYIINNEEVYADTTITINELTVIQATNVVPPALMTGDYPHYGVMNLGMDDSTTVTMNTVQWSEFLGWNWQFDNNGGGTGALNWSTLKEMVRDVGTSGTIPIPTHVQP